MNWDDLRLLLAATRSATLSEAARSLGITQTTVSRRLVALEEQLGVRLVSRTSQGVAVTDVGRTVAAAAEDIELRVAALDRALLNRDDALEGRLRVTTIDMVAHYDAALFSSFTARYPGIELEVTASLSNRNLGRNEADVAIRWTNNPPAPLVGRRIGPVEYAVYGSRALVEEVGEDAALDAYPWVAWLRELDAVVTAPWMRDCTPPHRVVARYDTALALHAACRAGIGVAFMPCRYAGPELVCLRPTEPEFQYGLWLLVHPDARAAARVRAFLDHVVEYFKPHSG